jgi:hypothetical protein
MVRWVIPAFLFALLMNGCGEGGDEAARQPLDGPAQLACRDFSEQVERMDTLSKPRLRRWLLAVWNHAQFSRTPGIKESARALLRAVHGGFTTSLPLIVREMRRACAGRTSPTPYAGF